MILPLLQLMMNQTMTPMPMLWTLVMTRSSIQTYYVLLIGIDTLQIADMLPSKTVPEVNTKKKQTRGALKPTDKVAMVPPKKKARASLVEVEEIEDEDSMRRINERNSGISPASSFEIPDTKKVTLFLLGSAVAVEQVFSGGQDTISLRRASLHADTIRILMLVKKRLHLAHAKANAALHH
jgi:hypothetical protein